MSTSFNEFHPCHIGRSYGKSDFPIVHKMFLVLYTEKDAGGRNSCEVNSCSEIFGFL